MAAQDSRKSSFISSARTINEKEGETNVYFRKSEIFKTLSMQDLDPFTDIVSTRNVGQKKRPTLINILDYVPKQEGKPGKLKTSTKLIKDDDGCMI